MRIFAISDIHGFNSDFQSLLKTIGLRKTDKLFLIGDFIDRGNHSKEVLDTILLLLENDFDIHCLMGNHEQLLLDAIEDYESRALWIRNGGDQTLNSFLTSEINRIPEKYIEFLKRLPYHIEFENYLFVHAGIDMTLDNPLADKHSLVWLRDWQSKFDADWLGERIIIHGHTPMKSSFIESEENLLSRVVNIDNGIYLKGQRDLGRLCALNLTTMEVIFS